MGEKLLTCGPAGVTNDDRRATFLSIFLGNPFGLLLTCVCLCLVAILPSWISCLILLALVGAPPLRLTSFSFLTLLCTRPLAIPGNIRGTYEGG